VQQYAEKRKRHVARMIAAARLVAGAVLSVSDLDLCLSLFISMTQTLLFYTLLLSLTRLPSLARVVLAVCTVCLLVRTLMTT
jgi:hypothetical protein